MKKLIYFGLFALVISGLTACNTTYNYYVAGLNKTNMSGYHTFAWMPVDKNNNGGNNVADNIIKDAATADLVGKGLQVNQRTPDLLVSYSTMMGTGTRTYYYYPTYGYGWGGWGPGFGIGFGYGFGWGRWGGYRPYYYYGAPFAYGGYPTTEHYKEGTIIIDLIDARTKQVVWRGFGVGEVHHDPKKDVDDLPKVIFGVVNQLNLYPSAPNNNGRPMRKRPVYSPASNSI